MALTEKLTAIGDAIREKNGSTELIPLADMPQAILDISGGGGGYDEGYVAGELAGRENQQSDFWDAFQYNGSRKDYQFAFGGSGWTDQIFKPKYDMQPDYASRMFNTSRITDLKGILETLGVALDFSKATSAIEFLANSSITSVGIVNTTKMSNLNQMFYLAKQLRSIDKLILKSDGSQTFNSLSFNGCAALTHMPIEGVIGQNGFDVHWSDLDRESLLSILNALADKSADTSGTEWKVKVGATNIAKLTEDELKIAKNKGWSVE